MWRSMLKVGAATAAFALVHSALATGTAKDAAERWLGTRRRSALYRPFYNVVAAGTFAAALGCILRQPSRRLYHVRGPAAGLMRLGQAAALAALADTTWRIGPGRFLGLPGLTAWLAGRRDVPREPEGQSPPPDRDGRFDPGGTFRLSRHPANLLPVPLLWLNPRMTTTLLAFNAVATAYFYAGSLLTDRRLRRAYGPNYEAYRRRVPLFLPAPKGFGQPVPRGSGGGARAQDMPILRASASSTG